MLRRVSGACGIASQVVGLTVISVAISGSPCFDWAEAELSILGVEGPFTGLFNGGLILSGLLSMVFALGLGKSLAPSLLGRWGAISLLLSSVGLLLTLSLIHI